MGAPVPKEFEQAPARSTLIDEQPILVDGNTVRRGHVAREHPDPPVGKTHADASDEGFGDVHRPARVECEVVRRTDLLPHGWDHLRPTALEVERAYLAPVCLRDMEAPVRSEPHAVRATERTGPAGPRELPALGQTCNRFRTVAGEHGFHPSGPTLQTWNHAK